MREQAKMLIIGIVAIVLVGSLVVVASSYINFDNNTTDSENVTLEVNNTTDENPIEELINDITSSDSKDKSDSNDKSDSGSSISSSSKASTGTPATSTKKPSSSSTKTFIQFQF